MRMEWNTLGEERMAALVTKAWDRPFVSLTDAVHWIATSGVPREPDYDELVAAADELVKALLQSGEKLCAFGIPATGDIHASIPTGSIRSATANGSGFLDDLNLFILPCIRWAHDPGEDRDLILGMSGPLWSRLSVRGDDLCRCGR